MAVTLAELVVLLKGDDKQLTQTLESTEGKTKSWASSMGGLAQGALMGVGMAAVNMLASAASATVEFVGDSVGAASDLSETVSKVNTLFGDSSTGILKWSETAATSFGLSQQAALDAAGGLGNLFMQLGAGGDEAAGVSQDMVALASDLASFHNAAGGTTEVLDSMTAAFRGEYDSVQKFIPTINGAAVELKALEMTGKENTKELTNLEKALAVQAIMMEDAGAATGDFARTSGGLANQQRILDAQMSDLKATVGEALLPVMLGFTSMLNNLVQAVLPPLMEIIRDRIVPAMESFGAIFGIVQSYFASFGTALNTDVTGPLKYWQEWAAENLPMIQELFERVLGAITIFWNTFGDDIMKVINNTFLVMSTIIGTALATVGDVITLALQLMTGDWEGAWETFKGIFERIWETIKTVVSTQLDSLKNTLYEHRLGEVGATLLNAFLAGIQGAWIGLTTWIGGALQGLWDSITAFDWKGAGSAIVSATKTGAESAWTGLDSWFKTSTAALMNYWNTTTWEQKGKDAIGAVQKGSEAMYTTYKTSLATMIDGVLSLFSGKDYTGTGEKFITDIETGIENAWNAFLDYIGPKALDILHTFTNIDWEEAGSSVVEGLKSGIGNAWGDLVTWWQGKLAELTGYLPFSEPKNPASPLRNLGKSGESLVNNWWEGAEKQFGNIKGDLATSLGGFAQGLNPGLGSQQGMVGAAGGMNIIVNVSGDNATYENGRAVGRGILDEMRRRGA